MEMKGTAHILSLAVWSCVDVTVQSGWNVIGLGLTKVAAKLVDTRII